MKKIALLLPVALLLASLPCAAQGPLTPTNGPQPTMKSLQEIWDAMGVINNQMNSLLVESERIQTQNEDLLLRHQHLLQDLGFSIWRPESTTLFVGSFAVVEVQIPAEAPFTFGDLNFQVAPEGADVSLSQLTSTTQPIVTLLAGGVPGAYTLEATDSRDGSPVETLEFEVTDIPPAGVDGPSSWFMGEYERLGASGAAWGGGDGGAVENYRVLPAPDDWHVAILFFDTPQQRWTAAEFPDFRDAWQDAFGQAVVPWFNEVSAGNMNMTFEIGGPYSLNANWDSVFDDPDGDNAYRYKTVLFQTVVTAVGNNVALTNADTLLCVSRSLTGPGTPRKFAWPYAHDTAVYDLNLPGEPIQEIQSAAITMPHDWVVSGKAIGPTAVHEIGHNLGLGDIYAWEGHSQFFQDRVPGGYAIMSSFGRGFPQLLLANKLMLGWVAPEDVKLYNFEANGDVAINEIVKLSSLAGGNNAADVYSGIEIRKAPGWNYYFELRQDQGVGVSDRALPKTPRVVGTDVALGDEYRQATRRKSIMLLPEAHGDGATLDVGEAYSETDDTGESAYEVTVQVNSINPNEAEVQVLYGVDVLPGPGATSPYTNPDPAIRPWSRATYQSPDIRVTNARTRGDDDIDGTADDNTEWNNVPWVNELNDITATIMNNTPIAAPGVKVIFRVKDFNLSGAPGQDIGIDLQDIPANGSAEFTAVWRPGQGGHYCIEVRIEDYTHPVSDVPERTSENNLAQSNYARFISDSGSPAARQEIEFTITNPYDEPSRAAIFVEQDNPLYRTFIETRSVPLNPNESRKVKAWFEYAYGDRPLPPDLTEFFLQPNNVNLHAAIDLPEPAETAHTADILGGGLVQIVTGSAVYFATVDAQASSVTGTILKRDGDTPASGGSVILSYQKTETDPLSLEYARMPVSALGEFDVTFVDQGWTEGSLTYVPPAGFGEARTTFTR